jgi:hypothetical protein
VRIALDIWVLSQDILIVVAMVAILGVAIVVRIAANTDNLGNLTRYLWARLRRRGQF